MDKCELNRRIDGCEKSSGCLWLFVLILLPALVLSLVLKFREVDEKIRQLETTSKRKPL